MHIPEGLSVDSSLNSEGESYGKCGGGLMVWRFLIVQTTAGKKEWQKIQNDKRKIEKPIYYYCCDC